MRKAGVLKIGMWSIAVVSSFFLRLALAEEVKAPVHLRAQYLDYDKNSGILYASGHATVTSENMVLEADEIVYTVDEEIILARGHVSGTDGVQDLSGHEIVYNLKTKTGELSFGKIYSYHWYISGPRMERHGAEKMYLPKGSFTTCDLEYPHYSIRAQKISVFPRKYVVCYNALLYVDDMPLFYLPVYYQSLRKKRYSLSVYVGHNSTEGDFVKVIYGYPLTEHTYGRLYLDYMEYLGWGKGLQYDYDFPDRLIGTLHYYYIHQKERRIINQDPLLAPDVPEAKRWNASFSHWQKFNPLWLGQARVSILSDESFGRRYNEEDWRKINNDITSFAALTKSANIYTFRVIGERRDLWHTKEEQGFEKDGYFPEYVYGPRVSFSTYKIRLPWSYSRLAPFYFNVVFDTKRSYTRRNDIQEPGFYLWDGNAQTTLSNRLNLTRAISLIPQFGILEYWRDKTSGQDLRKGLYGENLFNEWSGKSDRIYSKNVWQTQYFTDVNLRTRVTSFLDVDVGHAYTSELKVSPPFEKQGVLQNKATAAVEMRFSRTVKRAKETKPVQREYLWRNTGYNWFSGDIQMPVSLDLLKSELAFYEGIFDELSLLKRYLNPRQIQGTYKTRLLHFRSSIGYNLLPNQFIPGTREKRFNTVEERLTNLINVLTINPFEGFTITNTEEIKVGRNAQQKRIFVNQRFTSRMDLDWKRWTVSTIANYVKGDVVIIDEQWLNDAARLRAGLPIENEQKHNAELPPAYASIDMQNKIGFWLTSKWNVAFYTRFNVAHDRGRIMDTALVERGVSLYRDLHCWELVFSWNKFAKEEEAWIRFNLKAFPERKLGFYHSQRTTDTMMEEEWNIRRR